MTGAEPTPLVIGDILVTAPPGCGKTEFMAQRARDLVRARMVRAPRKILVVTFSNRAKDNLKHRMSNALGPNFDQYVTVTNFHGLGLRLLNSHGNVIGRPFDETRRPLPGSLRRLRNQICSEFDTNQRDLGNALRWAKSGAYTDEEVLERLATRGSAPVEYERRLRSQGRIDFDDALRLGLRIIRNPTVSELYRQHFTCVFIDEVQDLSDLHFDLLEPIGLGRTVFAGDQAQGIFGFAGANPDSVYARISQRVSTPKALTDSYRSAPAILRLVSALSKRLGGASVRASADVQWDTDGTIAVEHFDNPHAEAAWIIGYTRRCIGDFPHESIGVIVRAGFRRSALDAAVQAEGLPVQIWDYPAHRPGVVRLLKRFVGPAVEQAGEGAAGVDELYLRCMEELGDDDLDTMDELQEATEQLTEFVAHEPLTAVIAKLRFLPDASEPAAPGLHLLNAHVGKGQQFDRVVVLGMEDDHIPGYRTKTAEDEKAELAVLLVMVSRAKNTLIFTCCARTPRFETLQARTPSRWLQRITEFSTPPSTSDRGP